MSLHESPASGADSIPVHDIHRATVAAFYLPQFHRIAENDEWWGEGFTEWTNVRRSQPFFEHHRQPQLPGKLGYYDLLDPATHFQQQELAAKYGVGAFCYYIYWFGGRRLLEKPLDIVLQEQELPLNYFFCWANENWTRTWDGLDREMLVTQTHDKDRDARIMDDLAPHLADPRYHRVDGKPLLLIYRSSILDDPMRTTDNIRQRASALGVGEVHLAMVQSFDLWDPRHGRLRQCGGVPSPQPEQHTVPARRVRPGASPDDRPRPVGRGVVQLPPPHRVGHVQEDP